MNDLTVNIPAGESLRLLTAGKYCDRNITVEASGGGSLETVDVQVTIYGEADMIYMGADGAHYVDGPYGTHHIVKGSPVTFIYDGSTYIVHRDGSGSETLYYNAGERNNGHSCVVMVFHSDGHVLFEEV